MAHGAAFRRDFETPGCAGARSLLRHRRYDVCAYGGAPRRGRADSGRRLFPCHAATGGGQRERTRLPESEPGPGPSLRWIEADALRLPFPAEHFDLVTSALVFATSPTTMRDCGRSRVCCVRAENAAFWISESRRLDGKDLSRLLQERAAEDRHADFRSARALCISARIRRALSRARKRCSDACGEPVSPRLRGLPTHSALRGCIVGVKSV